MNKNARTFLIVAGALIIAGGMLLFGAFAYHGFRWNFIDIWSFATKDDRGSSNSDFEKNTYTFDASEIDALDISDVSRDVFIVTDTEDDKVTIVCYENEDSYYDIHVSGGTLIINYKSKMSISWGEALEGNTLTVYLPQKVLQSADISNVSGAIDLPAMTFEGDVRLHTTSGTITVQNIASGGKVTASSVSGKVNLDGIAADDLRVTSTSGTIDVESSVMKNGVNVSTISGSVSLDSVYADGDVSVETTSARITFDLTGNSRNYKFNSLSGSVQGIIAGDPDDFTIDANSVSGDENVPRSQGGPRNLRVNTTSGGIDVDIDN